jgi:hypothetical protein
LLSCHSCTYPHNKKQANKSNISTSDLAHHSSGWERERERQRQRDSSSSSSSDRISDSASSSENISPLSPPSSSYSSDDSNDSNFKGGSFPFGWSSSSSSAAAALDSDDDWAAAMVQMTLIPRADGFTLAGPGCRPRPQAQAQPRTRPAVGTRHLLMMTTRPFLQSPTTTTTTSSRPTASRRPLSRPRRILRWRLTFCRKNVLRMNLETSESVRRQLAVTGRKMFGIFWLGIESVEVWIQDTPYTILGFRFMYV